MIKIVVRFWEGGKRFKKRCRADIDIYIECDPVTWKIIPKYRSSKYVLGERLGEYWGMMSATQGTFSASMGKQ